MEIKTLSDCNLDELLGVFNESFSDYFVPLQLTKDQLINKVKADLVDFNYSVGAFVNHKLVGFILHGFDIINGQKVIYNAGTGVVPSQRKQGLTKRMYDFILPCFRSEKINYLVLEVISKNIPAIKSYEQAGFIVNRRLMCYRGETNTTRNDHITIREITRYDWDKIISFWDFSPSWQNSARVLESLMVVNQSYGAFINDQLVGYIVYNPFSKRVQQFGVDKAYRGNKIASTLFAYIKQPETTVTIINVEESSTATNQFLSRIGLAVFTEQLEMKLELN